jgi:hypothetical protein
MVYILKKFSLLLVLLIATILTNAQKQANYWYFGNHAGVSFALGPPYPLTNGALQTGEGCSSISTAEGTLEFYTDGTYVYNKNHTRMLNGSGLFGHSSSTQSAIIVPRPGTTTEYYIFTVDAADNGLAKGLCYSKVDMTLNGGLGDVVTSEKNISLVPLACEKVTAVGHSDGQSFWVITKKWGNADFYAYRITYDGVVTTPIISTTGPPLVGNISQASKGYLKVSPDGSKIASANNTAFNVGIYNFDNSTGTIEHLVTDNNYTNPGGYDQGGPYGVEFSPNSSFLYIGEWKANRRIHQYDLSSGDPTTILESRQVVASVGQGSSPIGALQLGPDNRLYIARYQSGYISRINQPNNPGNDCGFVENALNLSGRQCNYGLPPFIQSFFYLSADFFWDEPACLGYPTQFYTSASDNPDSVKWTFPGGVTFTELNPVYTFPSTGFYSITLEVFLYGQSKSVGHFLQVRPNPQVSIGNDTTICRSEAFYLDPGEYNSYQWQNGATTQEILADSTGWYWCRVANEWGCTAIDSLYMTAHPNPEVSAGPEITIAEGTTATIQGSVTGGNGDYIYRWEPAALLTNPDILQPTTVPMMTTTLFTLTVTNMQTGCTGQNDVLVTVTGGVLSCLASASPTNICSGAQSQLQVQAYGGTGNFSYSWSANPPGFTSQLPNPVVTPLQTTTYTVTVNDGENTVSSNVIINVNPLPIPDAGPNQVIIFGTSTVLHGSASQGTGPYSYSWEPADKLVSAQVQNPTTLNLYASTVFTLSVTDLGTGCAGAQPDFVTIGMEGDALSVNPAAQPEVICKGQETQLFALAGGGTQNYTYTWTSDPPGFTSSEADPKVSPTTTTTYILNVFDGFNPANGSITVTVNPLPQINLIPDDSRVKKISNTEIGVCVYDTITLNAGNPGATYLWSNGSEEQFIKILTSGIGFDLQNYNVKVTNPDNGCANTADIKVYFTFQYCSYGLDEQAFSNNLKVYPNPSGDGLFNYEIEGLTGESRIEIFSVHGSLLSSETIQLTAGNVYKSTINLQNIRPGIYYLKLTNNNLQILRKLVFR